MTAETLDGMDEALVELRSPSQPRDLRPYVLPHGPTPPTRPHLYPSSSFVFLCNTNLYLGFESLGVEVKEVVQNS